ncbi:Stf0 family sulfotransferase [Hyphomonas sp.]|uniref:Stf0 family sulfotransferase n=1 Tax=Hyphomonas sp. TaxID=87 RepID=UPI00391ABF6F
MSDIEKFLASKSVSLPGQPLDLSAAFATPRVNRGYMIVMTGRSGSTWLATALSQLNGFGNPREYFSEVVLPHQWKFEEAQDFSDVFCGVVDKYSDNGCFGFKINPHRLFALSRLVDVKATFSGTNFSWIDMRRWNLVKQALSFAVAKKSGVWHDFQNSQKKAAPETKPSEVDVSDADLWTEILHIVGQEQALEQFFLQNNIHPLRIYYEEIFDSKSALLTRVCHFIRPEAQPDIASVTDGTAKLDKSVYSAREQAFTVKFAGVLNNIYSARAHLTPAEIKQQIAAYA